MSLASSSSSSVNPASFIATPNSFTASVVAFISSGFGIFESAFAPCAYGIIADYFHPESRGTANSIYNLGIYFGGALSSLGVLFIGSLGWAKTYVLIGFIGIGTGVAG